MSLTSTSSPSGAHIVLDLAGSGAYSSVDAELPALMGHRIEAGELALLRVDKPGIGGATEGTLQMDATSFAAYTPTDLVDCAKEAIDWAATRPHAKPAGWVLAGHSEGALVVVDLAHRMVEEGRGDGVATMVLTGFPLLGLEHTLVHQQEGSPFSDHLARMRDAEAADLPAALEKHDFSAQTLQAWADRGPYGDRLVDVLEARIPTLILHGLHDDGVPAAHLMRWQNQLTAPWLAVSYVNGGHGGDLSMTVHKLVWIDAFTGNNPTSGFLMEFLRPQ